VAGAISFCVKVSLREAGRTGRPVPKEEFAQPVIGSA
jgi:hypothetical protein